MNREDPRSLSYQKFGIRNEVMLLQPAPGKRDSYLRRRGANVQLPCNLPEGVSLLDIEEKCVAEPRGHRLDRLGRKRDAGVVNTHALVQFDNQELGREAV